MLVQAGNGIFEKAPCKDTSTNFCIAAPEFLTFLSISVCLFTTDCFLSRSPVLKVHRILAEYWPAGVQRKRRASTDQFSSPQV